MELFGEPPHRRKNNDWGVYFFFFSVFSLCYICLGLCHDAQKAIKDLTLTLEPCCYMSKENEPDCFTPYFNGPLKNG